MSNMHRDSGRNVGALVLIGTGLIFLLGQFFNVSIGSIFGALHWPFWVILPGVVMLGAALLGSEKAAPVAVPGAVVTGTGVILLFQEYTGRWESWSYLWALYPVFVGLALMFVGARTGNPAVARNGRRVATIGLVMTVVFGVFMEGIFTGAFDTIWRYLVPIVLIGGGAFLLLRGHRDERVEEKPKNVYVGKPKNDNGIINPDLQRRIDEAIADTNCKYIASFDSSRVFRNSEIGEHTIKRLEHHGIEWHAWLNGHLSLKHEEHRLKTKVTLMLDEEISRRTTSFLLEHYQGLRDDMQKKGQLPYAGSRPMFGLARHGSAKNNTVHWEPDVKQFPIVLAILQLYATDKYSCEDIAEILHRRGVKWKNPARQDSIPYGNTIRRLIGRIEFYAPFVEDTILFARVLEIREQRKNRRRNHAPLKHPTVLLRGLVFCPDCGRKFNQTYWQNREGKFYPYYSHAWVSFCIPAQRQVNASKIDSHILDALRPVFALTPDEVDYVVAKILQTQRLTLPSDSIAQAETLRAQIEKLNRDFPKTTMSVEEYNAVRAELQAQLNELNADREQTDTPRYTEQSLRALLADARSFFEHTRAFSPDDANILMTRLVERVFVRNGEVVEVIRRVPI